MATQRKSHSSSPAASARSESVNHPAPSDTVPDNSESGAVSESVNRPAPSDTVPDNSESGAVSESVNCHASFESAPDKSGSSPDNSEGESEVTPTPISRTPPKASSGPRRRSDKSSVNRPYVSLRMNAGTSRPVSPPKPRTRAKAASDAAGVYPSPNASLRNE